MLAGSSQSNRQLTSQQPFQLRRCLHVRAQLPAPTRKSARIQPGTVHYSKKYVRDEAKECSRKYRRTTFDHQQWAQHRSTCRYWRHLKSGLLSSRIVRGLAAPLIYVGAISFAVVTYEIALADKLLPDMTAMFPAWQWPSIAMNISGPFSLSTFALSLLLVFRTNSSYQRWNEARKFWGLMINRSRDVARQTLQWFPHDTNADLAAAMIRWTRAFPFTLMVSLREDHTLQEALQDVLLPQELEYLAKQQHPGSAVLQMMGACVRASGAKEIQKARIDENITLMQDIMGGCERIFRTPIPLSYTRHTSRFLMCWLSLLPFCVADSYGYTTVPLAVGMAFFLFGIEEIGVQIEEPFGILALEVFCASIQKNINQAVAEAATMRAMTEAYASPATTVANPLDQGLSQEVAQLIAQGSSNGNGTVAGNSIENGAVAGFKITSVAGRIGVDTVLLPGALAIAAAKQQAGDKGDGDEVYTGSQVYSSESMDEGYIF